MSMRAYRIAYDGSAYYGFQRQPDVPTVEDALFGALERLDVLAADAAKPVGYAAAGRTDAGVSALAQTVSVAGPDWLTPRAMNAELPADVRAWAAADVPETFHATHDPVRREYTYELYAPEADGVAENEEEDASQEAYPPVDDDRIGTALDALSGRHDLHNLTPDDRNTERTLAFTTARDGPYLRIQIAAGGFCRELVRRVISLVRAVGAGWRSPAAIDRVLSPEPLPGHEGIAPAPPEPLVLTDVTYPEVSFTVDAAAAASARAVFRQDRIERRTGARVSGTLCDGIDRRH
ncbi:tRNA pseudouridine(38-40) synthase TruA [Halobacteria archaeon AArc-dxtr1]|nr:tRNA pseudouridine(38-40) synthase TruA [Halobacteria archaeon AArc-dxtr1]